MTTLKLGVVQMNSKVADRDRNVATAIAYIGELAERGAELIVVPEFFNTEYFAQYRDHAYISYAEPADGPTIRAIRGLAAERGVYICATIYEQEAPGVYFDTAFMVSDEGEVIGKYRKVHPAGVRSLELIYYRGGSRFPVWDVKGFKVGAIICYDWMFPEAARSAAVNGAELLLGPYAAPAKEQWDAVMITRAYENAVYLAPCNKVGKEGDWVFGGASMVVDPFGTILHRASTEVDETFLVSIDRQRVIDARVRYPVFRDRRPDAYAPLVSQDEDARGLIG